MNDAPKNPNAEDRLLEHEVDGIREYDNPLPRWWVNILYATVIFSALYMLNVIPGLGSGQGRIASYDREMAAARVQQAAEAAKTGPMTEAGLLAIVQDGARLSAAKEKFKNTCSPCHREDGGGNIGPNLTDEYWIHGGRPLQILETVTRGMPEKGMPAWGQVLKPEEVASLVAFVTTLRGTHPPNPKEPQGTKEAPDSSGVPATGAR